MTAARTASQRGTSNRRRGHDAERALCRWLRVNGFPGAERAVRTGFRSGGRVSADPGDVTGTPGIVWSVKDSQREYLEKWFAELDAMAGDRGTVRLLVHKRAGHGDPGRWWCWIRFHELIEVSVGSTCTGCDQDYPVRMEVGHVMPLLRGAGYGEPLGVAS